MSGVANLQQAAHLPGGSVGLTERVFDGGSRGGTFRIQTSGKVER